MFRWKRKRGWWINYPPPPVIFYVFFSFLSPDNSSWNNFNFAFLMYLYFVHWISLSFVYTIFLLVFCCCFLLILLFLYSRLYIVLLNKKNLTLIGPCLQLLNKEKEKCRRKSSISGQQRSHLKFETTQYL